MLPAGDDDVPRPRPHRAWTPLARALAATGDHWTLMIALALAPGRMRLTKLQRRLPGVSTGVLERYVQQMAALGLLTRERFKEMPPRVELELTDAGCELIPIAQELARWGMRHLWSPPQPRERVDLDALLRLLPALVDDLPELHYGSIETVVTGAEPPIRRLYEIGGGRLAAADLAHAEKSDAEADHRLRSEGTHGEAAHASPASTVIEGDEQAWIAALGPTRDHTGLSIAGDESLAERILDALPSAPAPFDARDP